MDVDVAASRIVAATSAALAFTGQDSDGEPGDPGTVTVKVTRSSGATVIAAGTATTVDPGDVNKRTVALTTAHTATVDRLTAEWTASGVVIGRTQHDVVGGVYCTTAEIRADGVGLLDPNTQPAAKLIKARVEVEYQFERACHRAFVPRFSSEQIDHTLGHGDALVVRHPNLREVVWADYWDGSAWVPVDEDLTTIPASDAGVAVIPGGWWPRALLRVGYRHGYDRCPPDLKAAAIEAIAHRIHSPKAQIDPRATSFQMADTGIVQLATPGLGIWVTAIPSVDAVLKDHRWRPVGMA